MTENSSLMFVIVACVFLIFFNFWSNSIVFGHVQQVHVSRCQYLVLFKQVRFVGFGHIQTNFRSSWFGQAN